MAATQSFRLILTRRKLVKFIELYRKQQCLWDIKHNDYRLKEKKMKAVLQIVNDFKQYCPEITADNALRKIESLRACYRKERQKIHTKRIKQNGQPRQRLWYFKLLSFLESNKQPAKKPKQEATEDNDIDISTAYITISSENNSDDFKQEKSDIEEEHLEDFDDDGNNDSDNYVTFDNLCRPNPLELAETSSVTAKRYNGYDEEKAKRHCTEIEDEYDAIGINVAAKLRSLPSNMRIVAEKLINDVLYQAQTNGLNSSSVITTPDPFK